MGFLSMIGAVSAEEYAKVERERDGLQRDIVAERLKLKKAVRDIADLADEIAELKPDALAMRKKRQDDSNRAQAKRDAAKNAAPVAAKPAPKAKAVAKKAVR